MAQYSLETVTVPDLQCSRSISLPKMPVEAATQRADSDKQLQLQIK